ncbi:MAG: bifunctional pyr operon transcriptional regulator/uracil phosphoribosyltransferase PyrR [Victivallaceae bacterium]|jgi:pyrimidine operon attenuation protein/uracil phosphoribosyltransferase
MPAKRRLCNSRKMDEAIEGVADAIIAEFSRKGGMDFAFIGIQQRGVPFARRLIEKITRKTGFKPEFAMLDTSMYRDDIGMRATLPVIRETDIPFDMNDQAVILTDDVLSSGRTIRAALDAITCYGRPSLIRLAVVVDRGSREFPIRADYAGMNIIPEDGKKILVEFKETDGSDGIYEIDWSNPTKGE